MIDGYVSFPDFDDFQTTASTSAEGNVSTDDQSLKR